MNSRLGGGISSADLAVLGTGLVAGLEFEELGAEAPGTFAVLGREVVGAGRATLSAAGTGVAGATALPPTPIVVHEGPEVGYCSKVQTDTHIITGF